jgi:sugar phosphate isomerase/epimerase
VITFSAFADEIGPSLDLQMDTCEQNGVRCIDVRAIDGKNVSSMTLAEASEYKKRMDDRGFRVPCIGSPIGKIKISDDFDAHLDLLRHTTEIARAFGTSRIRIFSFYPSEGQEIQSQRSEVMDRMKAMAEVAEKTETLLLHENEKAIYGARPDGVKDLFATVQSDSFQGIFDPANFVEEGVAPYDDGWTQGLAELTDYFHIKDKVPGARTCVPAGQGHGQFRELFADLKTRGWGGIMTLEPHMQAAEQFAGFTGPDLFAKAVEGVKALCDEAGLEYE